MTNNTAQYMNHNGTIVSKDNCNVFAFSNAMKYGVSVFEGIRGYIDKHAEDVVLFRVQDHIERLILNCRIMKMDLDCDAAQLMNEINKTVKANAVSTPIHIRILAYLSDDSSINARGKVSFVIGLTAMASNLNELRTINVGVSTITRISDNSMPPRVKCVANYVNNRAADIEAIERGFDGPIMLTSQGFVSEGTGACIFIVKKGKLITPSVTSDILESLTRDTLISLSNTDLGYSVIERSVGRTELYGADEIFWCGTAHEIEVIISVDGLVIGNGTTGPITQQLASAYKDIVHGATDNYSSWLSRV